MAIPTAYNNQGANPYGIKPLQLNSQGLVTTPTPPKPVTPPAQQNNGGVATMNSNQPGLLGSYIPSVAGVQLGGKSLSSQGITPTSDSLMNNPMVKATQQVSNMVTGTNPGMIGSGLGNATASAQAAHDAAIKSTQDALKTAQTALKNAQAQHDANVASYPSGVTPVKDSNGDVIPYSQAYPNTLAGFQSSGNTNVDFGRNPDGTERTNNPYGYDSQGNPLPDPNAPPQSPVSTGPPFQANVNNLSNIGVGGGPMGTAIGSTVSEIQNLQNQQSQQLANETDVSKGAPITASDQVGQRGITTNLYSGLIANAENKLQNQLTGQGQQITASGNAATLTSPQGYGVTTTPYNPYTNQYGTIAGANAGTSGLQNIGNIQGQIGVGQNVAGLNSQLGGANAVGTNLQSLIAQHNINPSGLTYANGLLQFGKQALSDPYYQEFQGQLNDFTSAIANIMGGGNQGVATDYKTSMASQIVNGLQKGQTMSQVIGYFLDQAKQKIQGLSQGGGAPVGSAGGTTFGNFFGQ